jgi:hypothetical protein
MLLLCCCRGVCCCACLGGRQSASSTTGYGTACGETQTRRVGHTNTQRGGLHSWQHSRHLSIHSYTNAPATKDYIHLLCELRPRHHHTAADDRPTIRATTQQVAFSGTCSCAAGSEHPRASLFSSRCVLDIQHTSVLCCAVVRGERLIGAAHSTPHNKQTQVFQHATQPPNMASDHIRERLMASPVQGAPGCRHSHKHTAMKTNAGTSQQGHQQIREGTMHMIKHHTAHVLMAAPCSLTAQHRASAVTVCAALTARPSVERPC